MLRSANYTVMAAAARKAGRALVRDFNEVEHLQVSVKGPGNFVSAADKRAEQIIFNELSKARPDFGFVMEESGEVKGKDASHTFIIDPLDGTTNFLHGIPLFAVSIGLVKDGVPVAGVIYNPIMDELYAAERGKGAFFNDRRHHLRHPASGPRGSRALPPRDRAHAAGSRRPAPHGCGLD